ncbi:MAG: M48 family peptidase, partial [Blastomonas fulva]
MAFNPEAATKAYIDGLGAEALAKSAAYTMDGHWMILWGLLVSALATVILVKLGVTDRIWAKLEKRGWALRTFATAAGLFIVSAIITLPWNIWAEWGHERMYDRT